MKARLDFINTQEVLLYLGCNGNAPSELKAAIALASELIMQAATPRLTYRIIQNRELVKYSDLIIGEDINRLLRGCESAIIFGATLGAGVDMLLARLQVSDMALAVVSDAVANSAIENVCDNFCKDIKAQFGQTTQRFSPGYGDYPFDTQASLAQALELEKAIGVTLNESGLMLPQKSVTAIFGIKNKEVAI